MKSLKLFLNFFACYCLVFQGTFANAKPVKLTPNEMADLNYWLHQMENLEKGLKKKFTTQEDHRLISYEFVKLRKVSKKWLWRIEQKGDQIAFRLNGKIQFYTQVDPSQPDVIFINNDQIKITKGMSLKTFQSKFAKILRNNTASLESLFFQEADAFLFALFAIAAVVGISLAAKGPTDPYKGIKLDRVKPPRTRGFDPVSSKPYCNPNTTRYSSYNGRLNGYRVGITARNYNLACSLISQCGNKENFFTPEDCIKYKRGNRAERAWNASNAEIVGLCHHAYDQVLRCVGGSVQTVVPGVAAPAPATEDWGVPETCPKAAKAKALCNNCSGNMACCADAGISCEQDPRTILREVDKVNRPGRNEVEVSN